MGEYCNLISLFKVKKKFAQVVIAMGDHGYLELEGGQLMVEFIVKQCSLPPEQLVSSCQGQPLNEAVSHKPPDSDVKTLKINIISNGNF